MLPGKSTAPTGVAIAGSGQTGAEITPEMLSTYNLNRLPAGHLARRRPPTAKQTAHPPLPSTPPRTTTSPTNGAAPQHRQSGQTRRSKIRRAGGDLGQADRRSTHMATTSPTTFVPGAAAPEPTTAQHRVHPRATARRTELARGA